MKTNILAALARLLAAIFGKKKKDDALGQAERPQGQPVPAPTASDPTDAGWLPLARSYDGVKEIKGSKHNEKILQFFRDAGHPEITEDETAWCAAFVGACLEKSGIASSKSLMAKSYLRWGKALAAPKVGCIAVFDRGVANSPFGHVGFYLGEDSKNVFVLGGNQSDAVNVSKQPKSKLVGYRWPTTISNSRTAIASLVGLGATTAIVGSAALIEGLTQVGSSTLSLGNEFKSLSGHYPILGLVGGLINAVAYGVILYARLDDLWNKGR